MRESLGGIKHPAFRDALALTRQGGRDAAGRYLVEDAGLVRQALESDAAAVYGVFAAADAARELDPLCAARNVPLYVVGGAGILTKLVGTAYETAVTAVAVVGKRVLNDDELIAALPAADSPILAGEHIQDPRNVGVLVRTADAVGCAALLLSADSAEPWSRQAVRSTTGSILRLPLSLPTDLPAALRHLREKAGARIVVSSGQAADVAFDADLGGRPLVLVVGNEQSGVSDAVIAEATAFVRLPMAEGTKADSLNVTVAAGALLYEAVRQRRNRGAGEPNVRR